MLGYFSPCKVIGTLILDFPINTHFYFNGLLTPELFFFLLPVNIALQIQERNIHSNISENLIIYWAKDRYLTLFSNKTPKSTVLGSQQVFINFYLVNFVFFKSL